MNKIEVVLIIAAVGARALVFEDCEEVFIFQEQVGNWYGNWNETIARRRARILDGSA